MRMTLSLLVSVALVACAPEETAIPQGGYADRIFAGGHIITMDPAFDGAEAVAVRGDTIVAVGSRDDVAPFDGPETRIEELGRRALIPGLIDTHGHFPMTARLSGLVNLSSPPVGTVTSVEDIVALLSHYIASNDVPDDSLVAGYGYDDSLLEDMRHPTRDDLDRVSTRHAIALMHVSGHLAAVNSLALDQFNIDAQRADPPGGIIRRREDSDEPNGVLEETAAFPVFERMLMGGSEDLAVLIRDAAVNYASFGITTAQDGAANPDEVKAYQAVAAAKALPIDIAAFPRVNEYPLDAVARMRSEPDYTRGYRVAGAKFSLDGSPQGRTAWLSAPYTQGPHGAEPDYVAYPTIDPAHYTAAATMLIKNSVPILAHANGDAAIDLMLDGIESALQENPVADHRSVIIHAQLMRTDQLDRAKELGVVPSFFAAHPFFWGDWHRQSFGDDRALNISPMRWATDRGVPYTIHNDSPVIPPDMMRLWWVAVNRKTRSGFVLGEHQRATVLEALHAMTLGAAYQYFEEDRKGSITPGKQADLVILDKNPLDIDPDALKDIKVLETIARGQSVFNKSSETQ